MSFQLKLRVSANVSTTFSNSKWNKQFSAVKFEIIEAPQRRPMSQKLGIWVRFFSLFLKTEISLSFGGIGKYIYNLLLIINRGF